MTTSLTGKGTRKRRRRSLRLPVVSVLFLAAGITLFLVELINFSQSEDRVPQDVIAGGVNIGGMLPVDARIALEQAYASPLVLYFGDNPILLDPSTLGFRVNWQTMVAEAISAGEAEGSFWVRFFNYLTQQEFNQSGSVALSADYQRSLLEDFLRDVANRYDQRSQTAGFDVATLTTFSGQMGTVLDVSTAINLVDEALRNPATKSVTLPTGQSESGRPSLDTLERLIIEYLDSQGFIYDGLTTIASVFILDLQTGEEINLIGDVAFTAASVSKVGILLEFFRSISREPSQEEAWLLANSLLCSRNSSSNLLMEIIGRQDIFTGIAQVTETFQYLGARNSFITAPFFEGTSGQVLGSIAAPRVNPNPNFDTDPDAYNQTTAEDMGTLFTMIYDCAEYGSGLMTAYPDAFTQQECRQMLNLMSANDLMRLLQAGIPEDTMISHKNGWLGPMVGDAGVVFSPSGRDYVISVFLWEQGEFQDFNRLWPLVEGISRATWNHFNPQSPLLTARAVPTTAEDCEGNYLPPNPQSVDLNNINAWRGG